MSDLALTALEGTNPLGFLAALGVLDALARAGRDARLRWTDELVPHAVITGAANMGDLLDLLNHDRQEWVTSTVLAFPKGSPLPDAKPGAELLRQWFEAVNDTRDRTADAAMLCALVAEGAFDGKGNAKPTHLHFAAGRQQFLDMARTLATSANGDRLQEAITGPWAYDSPLPSFSWDSRGDRIYAVRATNPAGEKRLGIPGADWLAFRGLLFYPVLAVGGSLRTTACDREWKRSAFRWPLWSSLATRDVVGSLVADPTLVSRGASLNPRNLAKRGILRVLQAPIRRTDQGGYGSFGGPELLAEAVPN